MFVSEVFFGLENSHRLLNDDSFTAPPAAGHVTESVITDRRHHGRPLAPLASMCCHANDKAVHEPSMDTI